jgi:hypothetical protein
MFYRYQLEMAVMNDVMPDGFEAADFEAAGLPVPGRKQAVLSGAATSLAAASPPANAFVCDTPDKE